MASALSAGRGFFPLDEELGLTSASLTPHALEGLVRLSTWLPFRRAVEVLAALTGVQVSEATARRWTETSGAAACAVQGEQADAIRRELPPAPFEAERLLLSADGAFVPLLHGEWAEAKLLVIGVVTTDPAGQPQTRALSYFAQVTEAEAFSQAALVETHRRGLERAQAVGAVMDGAEWLQGLVDDHRSDAVRILDFAHAASYVSEIGQAVQAAGTSLASGWLTAQLHCLKHEGPAGLLSELGMLAKRHPDLEAVLGALAYLEKREWQMQYPRYQAEGWPIGSGSVESGHKVVMQMRLKGPGMRLRTHAYQSHVGVTDDGVQRPLGRGMDGTAQLASAHTVPLATRTGGGAADAQVGTASLLASASAPARHTAANLKRTKHSIADARRSGSYTATPSSQPSLAPRSDYASAHCCKNVTHTLIEGSGS